MDLVIKMLEKLPKGHVTTMYGCIVIRIGDRYIVGRESVSIRAAGKSINEAAAEVCGR